jgi:hypothetical protein
VHGVVGNGKTKINVLRLLKKPFVGGIRGTDGTDGMNMAIEGQMVVVHTIASRWQNPYHYITWG